MSQDEMVRRVWDRVREFREGIAEDRLTLGRDEQEIPLVWALGANFIVLTTMNYEVETAGGESAQQFLRAMLAQVGKEVSRDGRVVKITLDWREAP